MYRNYLSNFEVMTIDGKSCTLLPKGVYQVVYAIGDGRVSRTGRTVTVDYASGVTVEYHGLVSRYSSNPEVKCGDSLGVVCEVLTLTVTCVGRPLNPLCIFSDYTETVAI